ncbi:hypothetical protein P7K49_037121 [Saguinus oedipus]|uniref:Nuclear transport factor 2 domain-containing protein n=1 Tax=Saguinus oedipus TaxID=9490 RepID=A0ABQ9TH64_SAGOE|nr:hypothetical protein P7K49_037121 [Saguinus oedipus]
MLHRFYGKNSSYVHGGLDSNEKPADAVYGQKEIHRKVMSQNFTNCHTKIRHVDAHATLSDGVVVQAVVSNDMEEHLEEPVAESEPDPEPEPEPEPVSEIQEEKPEPILEETAPEDAQKILLQHLQT